MTGDQLPRDPSHSSFKLQASSFILRTEPKIRYHKLVDDHLVTVARNAQGLAGLIGPRLEHGPEHHQAWECEMSVSTCRSMRTDLSELLQYTFDLLLYISRAHCRIKPEHTELERLNATTNLIAKLRLPPHAQSRPQCLQPPATSASAAASVPFLAHHPYDSVNNTTSTRSNFGRYVEFSPCSLFTIMVRLYNTGTGFET